MASGVRQADGAFSFEGGVDSGKVPTIRSDLVPNGLARNQLAWATNCTCRGGTIAPRPGWKKLCRLVEPGAGIYQGGWMYDAGTQDASRQPYLVLSVAGMLYQCRVDTDNSVTNLSLNFGLTNPTSVPQAFFVQGEEFMVEQIGDYITKPLIWDGVTLRRSNGI